MKKYLQGIEGAAPQLVGLARATVEVALLAGAGFLSLHLGDIFSAFPDLSVTQVALATPPAAGFLRWAEGWIDQHIDPAQNRLASGVGLGNSTH